MPAIVPVPSQAGLAVENLISVDYAELLRLLGPPDFVRTDGPAEFLQYRTPTCTLDVFLYRVDATDLFRVAHVSARDAKLETVFGNECLSAVVEQRAPSS